MADVAEDEFAAACARGEVLDCGDGADRRLVDAALIRRYCRDRLGDIDPHGIRIRAATVAGTLDLAAMDVPVPVRFEDCEFAAAPLLEGASLHQLALTRSRLPGLLANGLRVRRDLDLSGSRISGAHATNASTSKRAAVWLCESEVGGRLLCIGTAIDAHGGRAVQADRMRVGGTVRLIHGFTARGELRLVGARIDGSLDLTGVDVHGDDLALNLVEATIAGSMFLIDGAGERPVVHGRIDLGSASVGGQVLIRNATLVEPSTAPLGGPYAMSRGGGTAVNGSRVSIGAELSIEGTTDITGGVDLSLGEASAVSVHSGCRFGAPGRVALDLGSTRVRADLTLEPGVAVRGSVRLRGAYVGGRLNLSGTTLTEPDGPSLLAAQSLTVEGDVELRDMTVTGGQLHFWRATIGGTVNARGSRLHNGDGNTLNLHQARIGGSVRLTDGFASTGVVVAVRSTVDGRFDCADGTFANAAGPAVNALGASFRGGLYLGWRAVTPSVDFTNLTTSLLADDPARWPERFAVSGMTYERYATWDWRERVAWLARQADYDAGPYEQAALVYRRHGHAAEAERILIAQRAHAGRTGVLDTAYRVAVGYGYRPGRALWALALLLLLVAVSVSVNPGRATLRAADARGNVYATSGRLVTVDSGNAGPDGTASPATGAARPDPCGDGQVRCFDPVLYAVDTVVPLVSLDQRSTWYPNPHARYGTFFQWWLNIATLLGWLLSTIVVLSFTRLARPGPGP